MTDRDSRGRFSKPKLDDVEEGGYLERPPTTKFFVIVILLLLLFFGFPHEHARKRTCTSICVIDDFSGRGNSSSPQNSSIGSNYGSGSTEGKPKI